MCLNLYPFPTNGAYLYVFLKCKILFMNDSFFPRMKWNEAERYLSGFNKLSKTQSLVTETSKTLIPLRYMMLPSYLVWWSGISQIVRQKKKTKENKVPWYFRENISIKIGSYVIWMMYFIDTGVDNQSSGMLVDNIFTFEFNFPMVI